MADLVAAVDVGTGSARAGLLAADGRLLGRGEHPVSLTRPAPGHAEMASEEIWSAVGAALRAAREEAGARPEAVAGLAFDATCSLVLRGRHRQPLSLSGDSAEGWDTIAWLDHRACAEAAEIAATGDPALADMGGVISPEHELPKLLWLKRRRPELWDGLGLAMDLADFLAWKAAGTTARSACTLVCKWGYRGHEGPGWPHDFLTRLGLDDLKARAALPAAPAAVGADLGRLTPGAAAHLGLTPGCRVAAGLVDAHAGAMGVLGTFAEDADRLERRVALIAGTSSCLMAFARTPHAMPGIWGPYYSVALPGLWMVEGGQSVAGGLLDHLLRLGSGAEPSAALHERVIGRIAALQAEAGDDLAPRLHLLPDFHGSRSPDPDAGALGVISGLDLDSSFDGLCRLYWRAAVAIALGLKHILDHMAEHGLIAEALHIAGGHARSPLLIGLYADATGLPVMVPQAADPTLLGTAMAAATGAGLHPDLATAARSMGQGSTNRTPDPRTRARFARDDAALRTLQRQRRELDALLAAHGVSGLTKG